MYTLNAEDRHTGLITVTHCKLHPDGVIYYEQSGNAVPTTTLDSYRITYNRPKQTTAEAQN